MPPGVMLLQYDARATVTLPIAPERIDLGELHVQS